ncbi:MAG: MMPL family transporter [Planctomycetota bacterium]
MTTLARWLLRHRRALWVASALLLAAALASLRHLRLDFSIDPLLAGSAAEEADLDAFDDALPPRVYDVACVLTFPRPLTPADLDALAELAGSLAEQPDVAGVTSLATVAVVPPGAALPLPQAFPRTLRAGESVADAVRRHPLLQRRLLSTDAQATPVLVSLRDRTQESMGTRSRAVHEFVAAHAPPGVEVRSTGGALVMDFLGDTMRRDMARTLLLEGIACSAVLAFMFKSARATLLALGSVLGALVFSLGLLASLDQPISVIDVTIPGLITVIGTCDAIPLLHHFEVALARHRDRETAIVAMLGKVGAACLYTSVTTGFGFLSLLVSDHPTVRALGWKACVAVMVTFASVTVLLPLLLAAWPPKAREFGLGSAPSHLRLAPAWLVLAATAAVVAVASIGAARAEVDSYWLEELPPDAAVCQDLRAFEARFHGWLRLQVQLHGDLTQPDALRALESLQTAVHAEAGVEGYESVTLWLREVLGNPPEVDDAAWRRAAGVLRLAGDAFPRHVVTPDFSTGRIVFFLTDVGSRRVSELQARIATLARSLPPGIEARVAGRLTMAIESVTLVVSTMLESFFLSLAAIATFLVLVFRSLRLGLASLLPNVLPILVAFGLNGWLGIPLRIGIVMIYAVGLGLAVDDSIHLLTSYVQERRAHPRASVRTCVTGALRATARALVVSSAILAAGCLCYLPADFRSIRDVGILLTSIVVTALLADLFLLPHLIVWCARPTASPDDS